MLKEKLGQYVSLILPDHQTEDQRLPTLEENEDRFRQTARLVADGWLPPEHEYKGQVSRTPFDEDRFRKTVQGIVEELEDQPPALNVPLNGPTASTPKDQRLQRLLVPPILLPPYQGD